VDSKAIGLSVALVMLAWLAFETRSPARPIVAGLPMNQEVAALEAQVGLSPDNAVALHALVDAYLQRQAPGLAQAALDRAPVEVRHMPSIADQRVRTLAALGHPQHAFAAQSAVLAECSRHGCARELEARGRHRLAWLRQMLVLDVADPRVEPDRALLAYRLASRQARLELE